VHLTSRHWGGNQITRESSVIRKRVGYDPKETPEIIIKYLRVHSR